jgi:cell fate (sporulation/competence/biofilm development) regulator YlbF (YheA/YmcA/DUF963 family)|tara:strand:- start:473 stop:1048 length:576 start_codon:yes stop_codon:yes gene_type:complete
MGKVCAMDSKKQIEFIEEAWKKFQEKKKKESRDIDISKLKSVREIKQALQLRSEITEVLEKDSPLSKEQITEFIDFSIQKEIVDEHQVGRKEYARKQDRPDYFRYNVYDMMVKSPWVVLKNESKYTNINEPLLEEILPENKARLINYTILSSFNFLDCNPFIEGGNQHSVMDNNESFSFKGYSLADIIRRD